MLVWLGAGLYLMQLQVPWISNSSGDLILMSPVYLGLPKELFSGSLASVSAIILCIPVCVGAVCGAEKEFYNIMVASHSLHGSISLFFQGLSQVFLIISFPCGRDRKPSKPSSEGNILLQGGIGPWLSVFSGKPAFVMKKVWVKFRTIYPTFSLTGALDLSHIITVGAQRENP